MKTQRAVLVALSMTSIAVNPAPLCAQRHGRPDGVQMYAGSIPLPELQIQWTSKHELDRWRATDLDAMVTHSITVPLSKHSGREAFSGVLLRDVFAKRGGADDALLEVHYGFFHKKTLHWQELDPDQTIVTTRRNGSRIPDAVWLVAVDKYGWPITFKGVTKVVVKTQSADGE
jgi:hypothetical protein